MVYWCICSIYMQQWSRLESWRQKIWKKDLHDDFLQIILHSTNADMMQTLTLTSHLHASDFWFLKTLINTFSRHSSPAPVQAAVQAAPQRMVCLPDRLARHKSISRCECFANSESETRNDQERTSISARPLLFQWESTSSWEGPVVKLITYWAWPRGMQISRKSLRYPSCVACP